MVLMVDKLQPNTDNHQPTTDNQKHQLSFIIYEICNEKLYQEKIKTRKQKQNNCTNNWENLQRLDETRQKNAEIRKDQRKSVPIKSIFQWFSKMYFFFQN